jgi:hypothetical protein
MEGSLNTSSEATTLYTFLCAVGFEETHIDACLSPAGIHFPASKCKRARSCPRPTPVSGRVFANCYTPGRAGLVRRTAQVGMGLGAVVYLNDFLSAWSNLARLWCSVWRPARLTSIREAEMLGQQPG